MTEEACEEELTEKSSPAYALGEAPKGIRVVVPVLAPTPIPLSEKVTEREPFPPPLPFAALPSALPVADVAPALPPSTEAESAAASSVLYGAAGRKFPVAN